MNLIYIFTSRSSFSDQNTLNNSTGNCLLSYIGRDDGVVLDIKFEDDGIFPVLILDEDNNGDELVGVKDGIYDE